jgi:DNA polymerase elongation subunit (family B)
MIRTYSLLLRTARRQGFLVPGRQEAGQLQEHTFILHPVEEGTVGLYKQPVAILDFASLYPSIYRAHNLCYTTLVHSGDLERLPPEQLTVTPTGERIWRYYKAVFLMGGGGSCCWAKGRGCMVQAMLRTCIRKQGGLPGTIQKAGQSTYSDALACSAASAGLATQKLSSWCPPLPARPQAPRLSSRTCGRASCPASWLR